MAEFSKQYIEKKGFDFAPDFDIFEVAASLENSYCTGIICEGFGFVAIGKDEQGNIIVAMPEGELTEGEIPVIWKKLEEII